MAAMPAAAQCSWKSLRLEVHVALASSNGRTCVKSTGLLPRGCSREWSVDGFVLTDDQTNIYHDDFELTIVGNKIRNTSQIKFNFITKFTSNYHVIFEEIAYDSDFH
ncbi:hypothetical protein [Rhodovastum atsumiense]|uniref:Uncharacterized protein n=1 Tax=Rhodovastum atsumiense TaxID=504468 RepID=A0A5M6IXJ9_9PROT|nr:hypothetical protein [Rhodovastum atsumiense]KAA5612095.1 hypothetical protein F1189_11605 [Rhodovastum atsumiense]